MSGAPVPRVVYITSRGHSGSTLTEMLLGAHSRVACLGELKRLGEHVDGPCRCGAGSKRACPFWGEVDRALRADLGVGLAALDSDSADPDTFLRHNRALYTAAAGVAGAEVVVDASKSLNRLRMLLRHPELRPQVIHLRRSPYGVVYSNARRGREWRWQVRNYTHALQLTRQLLAGVEHQELRYERLARDPERELRRLMPRLGLDFEPAQLAWAAADSHPFAGNRMAFTRDSTIRLDRAWRRGLPPTRIAAIAWYTLPTRPGIARLHDALARLRGRGWRTRARALRSRVQRRLGRRASRAALAAAGERPVARARRYARRDDEFEALLEKILSGIDRGAFDAIAARHRDQRPAPGPGKYLDLDAWLRRHLVHALALELHRGPPRRILDLGAGAGYFAFVCRTLGHDCRALDREGNAMFDELIGFLGIPRLSLPIRANEPLPDFDGRFDWVTAFNVGFDRTDGRPWGAPEWEFLFRDLAARLLAPQGQVFLKLNPRSLAPSRRNRRVLALFREAGCEVLPPFVHWPSAEPLRS